MRKKGNLNTKTTDENALRAGECPHTMGCALNDPIHPMTLGTYG